MKLRKVLSLVMILVLVCALCVLPAHAASVYPTLTSTTSLSGRNSLAQSENADMLLWAYDKISQGIKEGQTSVSLVGEYSVPVASVDSIIDACVKDNPQAIWFSGEKIDIHFGTVMRAVRLMYDLDYDVYSQMMFGLKVAVAEYLEGINDSVPPYIRAKLIHDRMIENITFDATGSYADEAYGALVGGKASPLGYAKAYKYLLNLAGVECELVTGRVDKVVHSWNLVALDGNYYHTDVSSDDIETDQNGNAVTYGELHRPNYEYFNVTAEQIKKTHLITDEETLPSSTDAFGSYYAKEGIVMESFSVDAIASEIALNGGYAEILITDDALCDDFANQIGQNANEIIEKSGMSGATIGLKKVNGEFVITVLPEGQTAIKGDIYGAEGSAYTVELIPADSSIDAISINVENASYSFAGITAGQYTLKVTSQSGIYVQKVLTLGNEALEYKSIFMPSYGDVNCDGKFNLSDVLRLKLAIADSSVEYNPSVYEINDTNITEKLVYMQKELLEK